MRASKKSTITFEMDIKEASLIVNVLNRVYEGEIQLIDELGDNDESIQILKDFLDVSRILV